VGVFVGVTVGEFVGVTVGVVVGVSVVVGVDVGSGVSVGVGVFVGVSVAVGVSVGVSVGVGVNATQVPLGPSHAASTTSTPEPQPSCGTGPQAPVYWQQSARARLATIEKTNAASISPNTHLHPEPIMAMRRSRSGLRCRLCPTCVDPFVDLKQPL
jgi:hypothetical protein